MSVSTTGHRNTILIVEEEKEEYEALSCSLVSEGYDTVWASNGADAVRLAAKVKPDVAILNLLLHDRDGLDLLQELKLSDHAFEVIVHANVVSSSLVRHSMERGAFDFLVKPFAHDELSLFVKEAIECRTVSNSLVEEEEESVR